jgi:hypothetical protein
MEYTWTAYGDIPLVVSSLSYLGIDNVRDKLESPAYVNTADYTQLAADGIKFDFVLPVYYPSGSEPNTVNVAEFVGMLDTIAGSYPGSIKAIEGPNEVNLWAATYDGGTTLADQAALQQALYNAVASDPNLQGIPVYNLSMAFTDATQYEQLGNLSSDANYANSHAYLNDAQTPQYSLSGILPYAQIDAPGLPLVVTETGYETNASDTYSGVDLTVQAKLTLDELMDAFKDGVSATYLYELLDEGSQYFGLFTAEGALKPVATAIHDLTTLLSDPGSSSSFSAGSLSYAVENLPSNGNQLLLEKSNGTFDLVLWAETQIWNPNTATEIAAPADATTIEFGQTQNVVLVFDPLQGTAPIAAYLNTQSVGITLTDHPLVVEAPSIDTSLQTPEITTYASSGKAVDGVTLTGVAAANGTVIVFDNGTELGMATANASGAWSFSTGTLAAGANSFAGMAVDASGDVSATSSALSTTIKAAATAALVMPPIVYDYSVVNTNQVVLTGSGEANTTISIFSGTTLLGTSSINGSGAWSYTTPALAAGDYTFTTTATDSAGNVSAISNSIASIIDFPPTVASISASGSGIIDGSGAVSTGSTIALTLNMSETVTVTGGTPTLTLNDGETAAYTGGSGSDALTFSYTVSAGDKTNALTATAFNANGADVEDVAGNAFTGTLIGPSGVVQVNTTPETPPSVLSVADTPPIGDLDAGKTVTLTLNLSEAVTVAGGTPTLTLNDGGTATYASGSGSNALNFSYPVAAGQNTAALAVTGVNLNGATVTKTTIAAAGSGDALTDANGNVWSFGAAGGYGYDILCNGVQFANGQGVTLELVNGTIWAENNQNNWYMVVGAGWQQESTAPTPTTGQAANLTGAVTTLGGPLQIDTTPPAAPVITTDSVNANNTVTISGTAEANSTVTVYDGQTALGSTAANASGTWSYTTGTLSKGTQAFTATATDAAGNTSSASNAVDPNIGALNELTGAQTGTDTVANGKTLEITGAVDNTGTIALNASGGGADLIVVSTATLTGSGKVMLSNNAGNVIVSNGAPATLTNANNTISGAGTIGDSHLTLNNQGTIAANDSLALVVSTGSNTIANSGTLEATSSGGLDIDSNVSNSKTIEAVGINAKVVIESTVTNTTTGLVLASGSGAQVDLDNATIAGGTLQTSGSNALIETVSGSTDVLDGGDIRSGSTVEVNSNTTLMLDGTVDNSGTILVNGGTLDVNGALSGGTTEVSGAGRMMIAAASSENIAFQAKSTGELVLEQATSYTGKISEFGTTQSIDLTDINFTGSVKFAYASNNRQNTSGVLTITEGTQTVRLEIEGSYTLANFKVSSDGNGGTLLTDPTVVAQGSRSAPATIGNDAVLEISKPDSGNVTFTGTTGALWLDQPATFTGKVVGFGAQNVIDLSGMAFGTQTTLGYSPNGNNTGGTLTITEGAQHASIALLGSYMASSFVLEGDNHGGTMVVTEAAQMANQSLLATPHHG